MGKIKSELIWSLEVTPPFEEIEHTADLAFRVWGENISQLYLHARTALAFKDPSLMEQFSAAKNYDNLDDVIIDLNALVTQADKEHGCPLKAVSFSGEVVGKGDGLMHWDMIVDV